MHQIKTLPSQASSVMSACENYEVTFAKLGLYDVIRRRTQDSVLTVSMYSKCRVIRTIAFLTLSIMSLI